MADAPGATPAVSAPPAPAATAPAERAPGAGGDTLDAMAQVCQAYSDGLGSATPTTTLIDFAGQVGMSDPDFTPIDQFFNDATKPGPVGLPTDFDSKPPLIPQFSDARFAQMKVDATRAHQLIVANKGKDSHADDFTKMDADPLPPEDQKLIAAYLQLGVIDSRCQAPATMPAGPAGDDITAGGSEGEAAALLRGLSAAGSKLAWAAAALAAGALGVATWTIAALKGRSTGCAQGRTQAFEEMGVPGPLPEPKASQLPGGRWGGFRAWAGEKFGLRRIGFRGIGERWFGQIAREREVARREFQVNAAAEDFDTVHTVNGPNTPAALTHRYARAWNALSDARVRAGQSPLDPFTQHLEASGRSYGTGVEVIGATPANP